MIQGRPRLEDDPEVQEGWGVHDCCCDHIVEQLDAMPGTADDRRIAVRNRFFNCPHKQLTPLEVYLGTLV